MKQERSERNIQFFVELCSREKKGVENGERSGKIKRRSEPMLREYRFATPNSRGGSPSLYTNQRESGVERKIRHKAKIRHGFIFGQNGCNSPNNSDKVHLFLTKRMTGGMEVGRKSNRVVDLKSTFFQTLVSLRLVHFPHSLRLKHARRCFYCSRSSPCFFWGTANPPNPISAPSF